jgi:hypothetical protein
MRAAYSTSNAVRLRNTARQDGTAKAKKRAVVAVVRKARCSAADALEIPLTQRTSSYNSLNRSNGSMCPQTLHRLPRRRSGRSLEPQLMTDYSGGKVQFSEVLNCLPSVEQQRIDLLTS